MNYLIPQLSLILLCGLCGYLVRNHLLLIMKSFMRIWPCCPFVECSVMCEILYSNYLQCEYYFGLVKSVKIYSNIFTMCWNLDHRVAFWVFPYRDFFRFSFDIYYVTYITMPSFIYQLNYNTACRIFMMLQFLTQLKWNTNLCWNKFLQI